MGVSDHWQYQGRQEHGWFGHGTAPDRADYATYNQSVVRASIEDRVSGLVHGAIGALPASLRGRIESQYQHETLPRLKEALAAWIRGARLEPDVFASRFLGRAGDDPVARDLHSAAGLAATATSHADRAKAAYTLADAIEAVGVDGWPRFVADAAERARDPATQAAIQASSQPPPHAPDAIRPVYPLEWAIGAATGGLIGGPGTAARMLGGAIVRGVGPASRPAAEGAPAEETVSGARPTDSPAPPPEQNRPGEPAKSVAPDNPPFFGNIDDVLQETVRRSGTFTSTNKLSQTDALDAGIRFLGPGYREIGKPGSGVFRSADGLRQFRIDDGSLAGTHAPGVQHVHFEVYATPDSRLPIVNNHVPVTP